MEACGTVMSVAQTLFAALQNPELKEIISIFGYKSQLEDLHCTISTIQAVFQDAERKQTLSAVEQKLIEDLKYAVFEADDLLDEFATLAEQKQLVEASSSFSEKLRHFFTPSKNNLGVAYKMAKGVKKIRKKLDAIVDNKRFSFVHNPEPVQKRRPETCSYVNEVDIIGRNQDLENIVATLLDPNVNKDLSFLSIVGIGGMGKTTLAQLVFNDSRVTSAFPVRLWTCVSDQDQEQLDVKEVLGKILASSIRGTFNKASTLDHIQRELQEQLNDKRYLLVLDDVWTEKRDEWCGLVQYFVGSRRGSWIVVTTRSQRTATIIGDNDSQIYELQGLSEEDSWHLFKRTTFGPDESNPPLDLVKLGREIIDGCARVPLAIRVIGSLLYCQDKSKWQSVRESGLANIRKSEYGIMSILQLSYDHLESPLKSCFSYCAMFPKDFEINKNKLIRLWMAQGYIVPFHDGQSLENAGEEYFSILLKRCFFQDIQKRGDNVFCKMHDLIHDIAQSVSRNEIYVLDTRSCNFDKKIHHLSVAWESGNHSFPKNHIRSYIHVHHWIRNNSLVKPLLSSCRFLRALDLSSVNTARLPESICALLHLRYLDLSYNSDLELLPMSFAKLCNLQTLYLNNCIHLTELPKNLCKLVKLRVLEISGCKMLTSMPRSMDKLTCLNRLSDYIVGSERSCSTSSKLLFDGLEDLKSLINLEGDLRIWTRMPVIIGNPKENAMIGVSYLSRQECLNRMQIESRCKEGHGKMDDLRTIALIKDLHPHSNLKLLEVSGYRGTTLPEWVSLLPNLETFKLCDCEELDYLENSGSEVSLLPSLVKLELESNPKLKEWRRGIVGVENVNKAQVRKQLHLPELKSLVISGCPELIFIPLCPKLEKLELYNFNKRLVIGEVGPASLSTSCKVVMHPCPKLRDVTIDNVVWLNSLPMDAFHCLQFLCIWYDEEVGNLGEVEEMLCSCSSSLLRLNIVGCPQLSNVVHGGLEHVTALKELRLSECKNPLLAQNDVEVAEISTPIPCPSLLPSLCSLTLNHLHQMEYLPNWMKFLPSLQTLVIIYCGLRAIPNWMPKLTSLRKLNITTYLYALDRRCQKDPPGDDWPFIQHIPSIRIEMDRFYFR